MLSEIGSEITHRAQRSRIQKTLTVFRTAEIFSCELVFLDFCSHSSIDDQDALFKKLGEQLGGIWRERQAIRDGDRWEEVEGDRKSVV